MWLAVAGELWLESPPCLVRVRSEHVPSAVASATAVLTECTRCLRRLL